MLFDVRTLLVAVALAAAFCAGARFLLWRMNPSIPGLGRWSLAGGLGAIALILILIFGKFHWQPLLSFAQLFVVTGLVLTWDGFRRFIGQSPLSKKTLVILTGGVLVWIVIADFYHSVEIRAIGNAVIMTVFSVLISRELLTVLKPVPQAMRVMGWIYVANAAVFLVRAIAANQHTQPVDPLNPNGVAVFMLLWWLCMTIAVTLGMVLMTAERLQDYLDSQANRDPLTGALNRRSFSLLTEKAIARARRFGKPLSLLVMDLDKFKQINDRFGHDVGDTMLCQFVNCANKILRDEDVFCRFGGEEFIALLPNTSAELALVAAERLRAAFEEEAAQLQITRNNEPFSITVSIGIGELKQDENFELLFSRADTALYQAKENGRNSCAVAG